VTTLKILIISQYFPPEIGAAATRWSEYSNILADMGHDVTMLCELPNYPSGVIEEGYPRYWYFNEGTLKENLHVVRAPVWANSRKTTFQRLGFYLSFMVSATLRALLLPKYDVILVSSPPLFVGLIATFLRPFKRAKYILDLRDIWPESARALGEIKSGKMLTFGRFLERMVYRSVDHFFLAVPGFKSYLNTQHSRHESKSKFDLVNGVSNSFINLLEEHNFIAPKDRFTVLFSGNVGLAQGLETILDAAAQLVEEHISFEIIGDGAKKADLIKYSDSLGLTNVTFIPSMSRDKLVGHILSAHICLVPLVKSDLFLNAIPSKMYEYMAAGKPVIVGIKGEVESILIDSQAGISIEPEDAQVLAKTILEYARSSARVKDEGLRGKAFISSRMTKEAIMKDVIGQLLD